MAGARELWPDVVTYAGIDRAVSLEPGADYTAMVTVGRESGRFRTLANMNERVNLETMRERVAGQDRVLPYWISWGAGVIRAAPDAKHYGPGDRTVGHTGFGGSCVLADPDRRLTLAYAMTRQGPELVRDERAQALIAATYAAP